MDAKTEIKNLRAALNNCVASLETALDYGDLDKSPDFRAAVEADIRDAIKLLRSRPRGADNQARPRD